RVDHRFVLFEEFHELCHAVRIEIERGATLAWNDETVRISRFFHLRPEIQHDEIDVLNFVRSCIYELLRNHRRRYMSAESHPALVRFGCDDGDKLRLK